MSLRQALSRAKWALLAPFLAPGRARRRRRTLEQARRLTVEMTSRPDAEIEAFARELLESPLYSQAFFVGRAGDLDVFTLYLLVRALRPEKVVETGVASGRSSTFILTALDKNGRGRLHSVDLPKHFSGKEPEVLPQGDGTVEFSGYVPPGRMPGWLVPEALKERWSLSLGPSTEVLPKVLADLGEIDIFYHDSDHSAENMRFEFEAAWPRLRPRGILVSDDIHWNRAFDEFIPGARPARWRAADTMGLAVKP